MSEPVSAPVVRVTLRAMEGGDLGGVAAIERELYPNPWRREHFSELLALPAGLAWVAVTPEGEVSGYAVGWVAADEGEIANLAVARSVRRRGIGARLLASSLGEARDRGARRVWLEVRASNASARALYERHGFHPVGRRPNYYVHPKEDAVVMSLDLDPRT